MDYFQTMFYEAGDVVFLLDNIPNGKDFDLYVYNSNQKQIASSCSTNSMETVTIKDVKLNEWYYLQVAGYNKSFDKGNTYSLSVNHVPKQTDNFGHTFDTAKIATILSPVAGGIMSNGDSNYFKFTPSETGIYTIGTSGITDTYGILYDNMKEPIVENDDKPNDLYGNFEIKKNLDANKVYYIQVRHYGSGTGEFSLNITKNEAVPDNNIENSTEVMVNTEYSHAFNTADSQQWFSFTPAETGSYRIYSNGAADTYGVLYDNTKTNVMIENSNIMGTKNFELASTLLQGETYFIKVTPNNFSSSDNTFSLLVEQLEIPNDVDFGEQWGLLNNYNALDINILPAWQYTKGNGFRIGVADSGTYNEHEDLVNNIDHELSYNFLHDRKDVFPLNELLNQNAAVAGHGTHVAGIIGAKADNNIGVAGVAPEVTLVPLKVVGRRLNDDSVYTGSIAAFVNSVAYAQENNIRVINCSFGGYAPFVAEQEAMYNAKDILFVIVAGNDGNDLEVAPEYPACYGHDNSLVVAALNEDGELADFSNYGGVTDIAAPGEAIYGVFPYDSYEYNSGTSMAAPFVSAAAGLVWSNNLALTPVDVKDIVTDPSNVTKLSTLNNKVLSGGLLNAFKAVTADSKSSTTRSVTSVDDIQRNVFGRDIKASINYYKNRIDENLKTNQIIVKVKGGVDIDELAEQISQDNAMVKLEKVEYLELVGAYVFETSSVDEADMVVDAFNDYAEVAYSQMNYLRESY